MHRHVVVEELQCASLANLVRFGGSIVAMERLLAKRGHHRLLVGLSLLHLLEQFKILSLELCISSLAARC